jgi:DNA-binding IclR family transcriptional regulator
VAEIARRLGASKSLVFRVLHELDGRAYVRRLESGRYCLGSSVLELGGAFIAQTGYAESARRVLRDLSARTGDTTNLGILSGTDVLYVMKQEGANSVVTLSHVHNRLPAQCTALGKVLLAGLGDDDVRALLRHHNFRRLTPNSIASLDQLVDELQRVRTIGYAVDEEETILGRCCVAVRAQLSPSEAAALSISTTAGEFPERLDDLAARLGIARDTLEREYDLRATLMGDTLTPAVVWPEEPRHGG